MGRLACTLRRGALAFGSLAAALVAAELVVRSTDPFGISYYHDTGRYVRETIQLLPHDSIGPESRIFQNRPGVDLALETFRFATDDLGLRAADPGHVTLPREPGSTPTRLRILFLGDSVTLGWGVDDADTWVRRLERRARAADGRALECLNAGHLQYNSAQEADLLALVAPVLTPDAVVVTFVTNDLTDDPFTAYEGLMAAVRAAGESEGLGATFARRRAEVVSWFRGLRGVLEYRKNVAAERSAAPAPGVEDYPGYAAGWSRVRGGLDRMLAVCRATHTPLVLLDHGTPRIPAVRRWCEEEGVPWFDFTFSDEELAEGVRNSKADAHANERGNELLAAKAHAALAAAGWLEPPGGGE